MAKCRLRAPAPGSAFAKASAGQAVPKLAGEDAYATKGSRFLGKTHFSK
jgi:hypothetical protein